MTVNYPSGRRVGKSTGQTFPARGYPRYLQGSNDPSITSSTTRGIRSAQAGLLINVVVVVHAQADPALTLDEAHVLSGKIKATICSEIPEVVKVLVQMEPFRETATSTKLKQGAVS